MWHLAISRPMPQDVTTRQYTGIGLQIPYGNTLKTMDEHVDGAAILMKWRSSL
jgi:hypothetical protein